MWSINKYFMAGSVCIFLLGLGLFALAKPKMGSPPIFVERSQKAQTQVNYPVPPVEALSGPWFRAPVTVAAPAPKPAAAPVRVDKTSIILLGSSIDKAGVRRYFFKHVPSGQAIVLKQGETNKGWTLQSVSDQMFTLSGPGGLCEVDR